MPRPKLNPRHHKAGLLGRPGHAFHNATTVTLDLPTKAQIARNAQNANPSQSTAHSKQSQKLAQVRRDESRSQSSDSDRLVRRTRPAYGEEKHMEDDDPTMMHGALRENTAKANRDLRKSHESNATKRVRKSLQRGEVAKNLKRPVEKVRERTEAHNAKRGHPKASRTSTDEFAWSQDEMGMSPQGIERVEYSQEQGVGERADSTNIQAISTSFVDGTAGSTSHPLRAGQRPTTKVAAPATPSFLSIANFRRRPRQPSLLSMVRRAESRRNSVSTTVSRDDDYALDLEPGEESVITLGQHSEREDDVADLDIGAQALHDTIRTTSSRKRKRALGDLEQTSMTPGSSPPVDPPAAKGDDEVEIEVVDSQPQTSRSRQAPRSPASSQLPSPKRSRISDPQPRPQTQPPRTSKPARISSPVLATSPLSTPSTSPARPAPQPTSAANPRKSTTKTKAKPQKKDNPLTTATLASLLPKRRTRRQRRKGRDEFQVLSTDSEDEGDGDDDDDAESADELAASSRARARRKPRSALHASSGNLKSPAQKGGAKSKKTYGRRSDAAYGEQNVEAVSSGEENSENFDGDVQGSGGKGRTSEEMQAAKKKFEEVDDWEMSFESADIGAGGSSSPWR